MPADWLVIVAVLVIKTAVVAAIAIVFTLASVHPNKLIHLKFVTTALAAKREHTHFYLLVKN
jgi:hypothetical protein